LEENNIENVITDVNNVMIKKSTFTGLIVVLTVVIAISAFFAGSYVSDSDRITKSDLDAAIVKLLEF
jgi:hypothetical protein